MSPDSVCIWSVAALQTSWKGFWQSDRRVMEWRAAVCRKSPPTASFSEFLRCFPLVPAGLPGGKQRKETLQGKASASAAHVAGCGLHLEGFGPPNLLEGFFDSLRRVMEWRAVFFFLRLVAMGRESACASEGALLSERIFDHFQKFDIDKLSSVMYPVSR